MELDFKTQLWEGTAAVYERYSEGKAQSKDVLAICTARVAVEERYAKEMGAVAGTGACGVFAPPWHCSAIVASRPGRAAEGQRAFLFFAPARSHRAPAALSKQPRPTHSATTAR